MFPARLLTVAFFTVTGLGILAMMLLCWGWPDGAGFLAHPARIGLLAVTVGVFAAPMVYMPPNAMSPGDRDHNVGRQMIMPALAGLAMTGVLATGPWCDARDRFVIGGETLRWIGLGLYALGAWFSAWGPMHLGPQFSMYATIQTGHRLVTDGPYAIVRHPRYFGFLTWAIGGALVFRSVPALGCAVVITALLVWRIIDEEAVLCRAFGASYRAYRTRTKCLIPFFI